uniref:Uncharacterized protein n=1 Tax=Parascaris equorum TaxID=6256 RepID=A0A914S2V9_PAREQ
MCATSFRLRNAKQPGSEAVDGGGCGFSRAAAAFGSLRMAPGNPCDDVWYNMERFQLVSKPCFAIFEMYSQ